MQTLNPADFLDTRASPKQSKETSEARIKGVEADVAPAAARADINQSQTSAASSAATAERTRTLTPLEAQKLQEDLVKMRLENAVAAKKAAQPIAPDADQVAQKRILGDMNTAVDAINIMTKLFNENLSGQGIVKSTLEYFPSQAKGAIDTTAAGLADVGLALFKIPGAGSQSDSDALRFVQANQPSASNFDLTFLGKVYNLRRRIDAKAQSMGLPPIPWTEPLDMAARQYLALPESERSKLGVREVGTFKDIPADYLGEQAAPAAQADTTTALPSNAAFGQAIPMSAAASDAAKKSMPIPPEMQADMNEWFGNNPRGTVGLKSYSNFRRALDAKYGFRPDLPYEDDPRTIEYLKQYNDPKSPVNVTIPPVTVDDTRNAIERFAGTAVMNPIGTAVATGASTAGLNIMDALLPEMAQLRAMNPKMAMIGDIVGSIGGNAALRRVGNAGLSKLLSQAPELEKYFTGGNKAAQYAREFAGDLTGDVIQGTTYGGAVEGDAGTGAVSSVGGNLFGRGLGAAGKFVLGGSRRSPQAQKLMDEYGIEDLTIGQQYGGVPKSIEDAATSVPFVGDIINARRGESVLDFNDAAFRTVAGQPIGSGNSGLQTLEALRKKAYDEAVAGKTFDLNDPIFTQDMADAIAARSKLTDALKADFDVAIKNSLGNTPTGRTGNITGEDYQQSMRALIGYANAAKKPGFEKDFRDALKGVRNTLSDTVQRQDATIVPGLKAADAMYRGEKVLEDAISRAKMDPTGLGADVFTPGNLTQAVAASGRKFDGPMSLEEISQLAQNVIPSKLPDSGTARRAALAGLGTVGLGGIAGGGFGYNPETGLSPEDALSGAATVGIPLAALAAFGSRPGQKALSKFLFDRPEFMKSAANLADLTGKYKYVPDRLVSPALMPVLMPDAREEPVVASPTEVKAKAQKAAEPKAPALPTAAEIDLEIKTDTATGREYATVKETGETYFIDNGETRTGAKKLKRGGTVQAFRNGGMASIADMARHYGMRR